MVDARPDAADQALRRGVNKHIVEIASSWGNGPTVDILCECGRPECLELARVPQALYRAARESTDRFVVFRAHRPVGSEVVVDEGGDLVVVELVGPPGATVEPTDKEG